MSWIRVLLGRRSARIAGLSLLWVLTQSMVSCTPAFAQSLLDLMPHRPMVSLNRVNNPDHWMAIVGDSGVTGAASERAIEPNLLSLFERAMEFVLSSQRRSQLPPLSDFPDPARFHLSLVEPMTRVLYSKEEFKRAQREGTVNELNLQAKASLALDMQEHSNGYLIGRALDIEARDIVMVGQDGLRVSSLPEQFARIFEMQTDSLPPLVLVSFTANDFCDDDVFSEPLEIRVERFRSTLATAWMNAAPSLRPHPKGTSMVILPALDVVNVLANQELLQQKVFFQGMGEVTCASVRQNKSLNGFLSERMARSLGGMCRSVLNTRPSESDKLQRLRDIQNAFNEVWKNQVDALNKEYGQDGLHWAYVEELRQLNFAAGDLANDCFHPGVGAHAKIADLVLKKVFGK